MEEVAMGANFTVWICRARLRLAFAVVQLSWLQDVGVQRSDREISLKLLRSVEPCPGGGMLNTVAVFYPAAGFLPVKGGSFQVRSMG